jgi:hypothetical protein
LHLGKEFDIKDLGILRYFLDIEITCSHKDLFLSQRKYVLDLLKKTRKMGAKPANVPIAYNHKSIHDTEPLEVAEHKNV